MTDHRHPSNGGRHDARPEQLPALHRRADWRTLRRWQRGERLARIRAASEIVAVWIAAVTFGGMCMAVTVAAATWVIAH